MADMQLGFGSSSSTTHRLTQSSRTLDRRYVERPSNLAIEEAARSVHSSSTTPSSARPSRLVNLRVHASEILQAETEATIIEQPQVNSTVVPKVVEYGAIESPAVNLAQMVPDEAPIEPVESVNYMPVLASESTITTTREYDNYPEPVDQDVVPISNTIADTDSQALAMNIAADYAAASLGASMQSSPEASTLTVGDNSIDAIAQATSEAIAAIRMATDPEEVAEQVASLKSFAENIKASSSAPEMLELSSTIEKFVDVAMKSSRVQEEVQKKEALTLAEAAAAAKAKAAAKITKKPSTSKVSKISKVNKSTVKKSATRTPSHPASRPVANTAAKRPILKRTVKPSASRSTLVADEDQALRKALRSVASMEDEPAEKPLRTKHAVKKKGSGKRFALAFFCAVICVAGVVYFVGSNIPDISVRVAAMQTGIEASYPSYVPRDFSLSDISSEEGKITLTFRGPDKATFTLTEEKSSWDSTAVLRNYVEPNWSSDYITTHEQGITIYISDSNAAWVNGGVLYKINTTGPGLTKKQLRNIVTSL